jgi:uncharacterized protein (DUF885 family)
MDVVSKSHSLVVLVLSAAMSAAIAGCVTVSPPVAQPQGPSAADVSFEALSARYLDEMIAFTPVSATQLGDHRFDARLDDVSAATRGNNAALAKSLLEELAKIPGAQLSRAHQVDVQLLRRDLQYQVWQIETLQEWKWNPLIYTNLAGSSVYSLMSREFAPLPERLTNAAARLAELPRLLAQVREVLTPARVPRIHAETAVKQNAGVLTLIDQLIVPELKVLPEAEQTRVKGIIAKARTAVTQHQIWLEKRLLPEAKGEFRIGAPLYDAKLGFALASPLSRQEIRARADAALISVRSEMYAIARKVLQGRPKAPALPEKPTPAEQQAAIVAALEVAYAERPERDQVFETARRSFDNALQFVKAKDFITVYDDPLEIIPMPEFQRGVALAYCDSPGPLDKGLKTFYAVSPIPSDWNNDQVRSYLREYNTRSIHELTLHEAMPGHYLQLMHSNRYRSPLRAVLASGAFIEGWAVYGEQVMIEQGYMNGDPLMHLIQLKWYLRSVANAILDQAVHVDGMTRDAAIKLMTHDTFQEEREAAGKWVRAQLTFAQLPTYFVGAQEHLALREEAKSREGAAFSLKSYHDKVLSYGSPPVRYARALMFDLPIEN